MIDLAIDETLSAAHTEDQQQYHRLKAELHERLVGGLNISMMRTVDPERLREEVRRASEDLCISHSGLLSRADRERLIEDLVYEMLGLGPLEPLMADPTVSDILINGPFTVYVERRGRLELTDVRFRDLDHLLGIVQRIVGRVGRRIDEASPMVDARLPDGGRLNAILRPLALDGALVSIRRFGGRPMLAGDLVARKSATSEMLEFLAGCVRARLNVMISGGTGSGKTTMLNMLSSYIPADERIVTIEDAAELQLQQPHVARLETRPANLEGRGEVTSRDLLRNALRMRPDRIIVGECRGKEAFDMLQAMNTGHSGGLTTIHANDTRDAVNRVEMLVGMAAPELPLWFIHRQIASAINIVVQTARTSGGARKIVQISEVLGLQGDTISMHDVFVFDQSGMSDLGEAEGSFMATGIHPHCLDRLRKAGVHLPLSIFERGRLEIGRAGSMGLERCVR
ncbi:MAG TPA: CpaF family protein [Pirellulales bacterium]|jgi:pilus assembly protein CpaF|nr:CpaF family protein [Pirellulales bacterium]